MIRMIALFPGQGSQYPGMGKKLLEQSPLAKDTFEEAGDSLGLDLIKLCTEADQEELNRSYHAQPALLTTGVAAYRVFEAESGIKPVLAAGHSLGEYSALVCAHALSFREALQAVYQRGVLMQAAAEQHGGGTMVAVLGVGTDDVKMACERLAKRGQQVWIANANADLQTVVSGAEEALALLQQDLLPSEARIVPLHVGAPFHCPLMEQAALPFSERLSQLTFRTPDYPVLSNVTARPYRSPSRMAPLLYRQITKPVRWKEMMVAVLKQGFDFAVELGPKTVLRDLLLTMTSHPVYAWDVEEDRKALRKHVTSSAGSNSEFVSHALRMAASTPNRNQDLDPEAYEQNIVLPYRRLEQLYADASMNAADEARVQEAETLLQTILSAKTGRTQEKGEPGCSTI